MASRVLRWLQITRCKWLLVMVLLCLGLRENYPFSHFPMYSAFADRTYFLYLADTEGRPIATQRFGLSSSTLKKIFERRWLKELGKVKHAGEVEKNRAANAAAASLLGYLDGLAARFPDARKLLSGARVQHVLVQQKSDALFFETHTLAQHR